MESLNHAEREQLEVANRLAHIGSWSWDVSTNRVEWSDELFALYKIPKGSFGNTYESFLDLLVPEDREKTRRTVEEAMRDCKPFEYDHRIRRGDGAIRLLRTRGIVIQGEDGEPVGLVGACWDITDEHKHTSELERTVAVLHSIIEATADGILVVDHQQRVVVRNEQFLKMWRIPRHFADSKSDTELLEAVVSQLEAPEEFLERVRSIYDHSESQAMDAFRFKDGRIFERKTRPYCVAGHTEGRVWSFRDVTEERRLLSNAVFLADVSRLLASLDVEAALQAVVHSMVPTIADAVACDLVSEDGTARRIGTAVSKGGVLPDPPSRAVGQPPQPRTGEQHGRSWLRIPIALHGVVYGFFTLAAEEGRQLPKDTIDVVSELALRTATAVENARIYHEAQDALHKREEFLSVVAHEIRSPLTTVRLATQALQRGGLPPEQMRRVLDMLEREDRRIAGFVNDLLEMGRIQAGRFTIHLEQVNLSELVGDVVARLTTQLTGSRSTLSLALAEAVTGTWDKRRLDQVVTNLITNAIKYGAGKPIEVVVTADEHTARLAVTDHGIGIPEDKLGKLFQPFERAVSSRQYGGLGLGLFIVKSIVDQLGGTVVVRSVLGKGSTFEVTLPRHSA